MITSRMSRFSSAGAVWEMATHDGSSTMSWMLSSVRTQKLPILSSEAWLYMPAMACTPICWRTAPVTRFTWWRPHTMHAESVRSFCWLCSKLTVFKQVDAESGSRRLMATLQSDLISLMKSFTGCEDG